MQMEPRPNPVSRSSRAIGGGAYFLIQTAAWTLYGVIQYLLSRLPFAPRLAGVVAWCATGMIGTEILRWLVNRRRSNDVPDLIAPFALAVVLIPAAMVGTSLAVSVFVFHDRYELTQRWLLGAHFMQAMLLVSVWCAVVLAASEVKRRRVAELESLQLALIAEVAQFRALRSQLNPHFLFNCLNSLRELVDENPQRAKHVIELLSALLRYTLRADRVETVSLKEELSAVEDYLSIEKIRFEERLQTEFDIDPRSLGSRIPPMLLQTLAENGLKHGIARLPAGGAIRVATRISDETLRVEVVNTGVLEPKEGSLAVGLENARERLRLMYGDRASLTLTAADACKVRAEVVIPLRAEGLAS